MSYLLLQVIVGKYRSNLPEVFLGKAFWKYTVNLWENNHAEVWFVKSKFGVVVLQ